MHTKRKEINMNFIAAHQLNVMLFMSGMCGILAFMVMITKSLPRKTKQILSSMELSAALLLLFDRLSYIYRGDVSLLGFYMVRIGNMMVFIMSLVIPFLVTRCIYDVLENEAKIDVKPPQLIAADCLFAAGMLLVILNQFTGLYYTFDDNNNYQRAPFYIICYVAPVLIVVLQEWTIIQYRKKLKRGFAVSLLIFIVLPTVASVLQIFLYGISLTNMVTALVVCVFYTYTLNFLSEAADKAKRHEIEFYRQAQLKEAAMFRETTEALAKAIDTKDKYTRGHSTRVAVYSRMIAEKAGLSDEECSRVYVAALLHDIGKIGISNDIINKPSSLTEEEFALIKTHSEMGYQILSSIKHAPFLSEGAHYHHERYDGKGYPAGLSGTDIPETARIIAVADAYDAMTSYRSYRDPLDKEKVRDEIIKGTGTQFDPEYAKIMVALIDEGKTDV